uniref:Uncharacterized protein n=1 Tax=Phasianus colchicus TaxID=9054 RepID=A0A669PSV6_PHACC
MRRDLGRDAFPPRPLAAARRPAGPMAAEAVEYEAGEPHTRVFRVGALGSGWRQCLQPRDLSLAEEEEEEDEEEAAGAVAEELGCTAETAAELRALCSVDTLVSADKERDPEAIPEDSGLETLRNFMHSRLC